MEDGNLLMESSAPKSGITRPTETPENEKTVMNKNNMVLLVLIFETKRKKLV